MSKHFHRIWIIGVTAALAPLGCGEHSGQSAQQKGGSPPPKVGIVELQAERVELFTKLPGRTSAYRVAEVRPQVTGILQKRRFKQGAQVSAGQSLYKIDPRSYKAALDRAKADLAQARAAVTSVRRRKNRLQELIKDNAVSQQKYDDAKANLKQRQARIQAAEAAVKTARINLDYTSVEAPIKGRIGPARVTTGALVTANQKQPLVRITRLDPIYVDIQRSVTELRRLRDKLKRGVLKKAGLGKARVTLLLESAAEYPHSGKLKVRDITVNESTGSVTLRAVFPNPDQELLPGMYVRARLSEGVSEDAILAPQQGVTHNRRGRPTALVVNSEHKVVKRQLKVDRAIGSSWLVEKGLKVDDRLIVSGLQKVQPGAKVKPVPADIPNKPGDEDGGDPGMTERGSKPEPADQRQDDGGQAHG